jgi:predicted nucleic acid-binding protein
VTAADTSVVVAAFGRWHERHDAARHAVAASPLLLAPVAIETLSVLTRLPPPHRAPPDLVLRFLAAHFDELPAVLSPLGYRTLLHEAEALAIVGGALYDAVVAATAREAGAVLVSLDLRAAPTYRALGVEHAILD